MVILAVCIIWGFGVYNFFPLTEFAWNDFKRTKHPFLSMPLVTSGFASVIQRVNQS
jgi:hypothetical protein